MKLDVGAAQKHQKRLKSKMQGGMMRLKDGRNKVRILPWSKKTGKAAKEDEAATFWIDRVVHFTKLRSAPEDCLGAECPHCERADKLMGSEDEDDQKTGGRIGAREQTVFLVYDTTLDSPKPVPMASSPSVAAPILAFAMDEEEYPDFLDYEEGRVVIINRDSNAVPSQMYSVTPGGKSTEVPKSILKLIDISKHEVFGFGVKKKKDGEDEPEDADADGDKDKDEDGEEEEKKSKTSKKGGKSKKDKKSKKKGEEKKPDCYGEGWEDEDDLCKQCDLEAKCEKKTNS